MRREPDEGLEGEVGSWGKFTGRGKTLKGSIAREKPAYLRHQRMVEKQVLSQGRGWMWPKR